MNYNELSDKEIDIAVSKIKYCYPADRDVKKLVDLGRISFCSNWSDAGRLMEYNDICLVKTPERNKWYAYTWEGDEVAWHENPMRAIATCFLLGYEDKGEE